MVLQDIDPNCFYILQDINSCSFEFCQEFDEYIVLFESTKGWHQWHSDGIRKHPDNVCETEFNDSIVFKLTTSAANFFIPMILMVVIYYKIFCEIKRRGKIDIGRNLSVSCADHRSSLSKSSIRKQRKLLDRTNYVQSGGCSSCSSFSAKKMSRITFNSNEQQLEKSSSDMSGRDKASSEDLNASAVSGDKGSANSASSVKHYQQLTLMSVKPEKPVLTALEDYKGVKVEVEYINGGSTVNIINKTSLESDSCGVVNKSNDQKSNPLSTAKVLETNCDSYFSESQQKTKIKSKLKSDKKLKQKMCENSGKTAKIKRSNGSDVDPESDEQLNDSKNSSIKLKLMKKIQNPKKSVKSNLEVNFSDKRSSRPSIALPANEFCNECQCTAAAAVAATHHINALRREESSRLRQEKKAARQLGVILGAFILCWMPYIITFIVTAYCTDCVSNTVHQVAIWLGEYFSPSFN